jgi:hypothetical protein
LRLMIVRAAWTRTVVFGGDGSAASRGESSSTGAAQPSSTGSRVRSAKRLPGLKVAPRPRVGAVAGNGGAAADRRGGTGIAAL